MPREECAHEDLVTVSRSDKSNRTRTGVAHHITRDAPLPISLWRNRKRDDGHVKNQKCRMRPQDREVLTGTAKKEGEGRSG